MKKRSIRWIAVAAIFGGAVASSPNSPAKADTFRPLPAEPSVNITSWPNGVDEVSPGTNDIETVTATIGLEGTVGDLSTVTMCLYKDSGGGGISGGTNDCSGTEAANEFKVTWTQSTNAFAINSAATTDPDLDDFTWKLGTGDDASSATTREAAGSGSYGTLDRDHQGLQISFKFSVSRAMLAGSDWKVKVAAEYPDTICASIEGSNCSSYDINVDLVGDDTETLGTVNYYSVVTTGAGDQSRLNYGFLLPNTTSLDKSSDNGDIEYVTNAYSNLTVRGGDFTAEPVDTLTLTTDVPTSTQVRVECADVSGSFFAVPRTTDATAAQALGVQKNATSEEPVSAILSCRLTYGGGAKTALVAYSNTITVGVLPEVPEV